MRAGKKYRHEASGDLDIYVVKIQYQDEKRIKAKILYVGKRSGEVVYFGFEGPKPHNVIIKRDDLKYWKEVV